MDQVLLIFKVTFTALRQFLVPEYTLELIDSAESLQTYAGQIHLWVMPGGADRFI